MDSKHKFQVHHFLVEWPWASGFWVCNVSLDFPGVLVVKSPPANAEDKRDAGPIPGSGRPPGEGHGNPLQYSCLENPSQETVKDREALRAAGHGVSESHNLMTE